MFSYAERAATREALVEWILEQEPTHFLTLNFNETVEEQMARRLLGKFLQRIDRKLLGPRYAKLPHRRTWAIAFSEHPSSNFHWHCICRFDRQKRLKTRDLKTTAGSTWEEMWSRGQLDLQRISYSSNLLMKYVTKDMFRDGNYNRFVISSEFWSDPAL